MNINGFIGVFAFAILSLLSRAAFVWLLRLSYKTAGKTLREVEKHYDEVKRKTIAYEREITWLTYASPKPMLTGFLYISYYVLCSLGIVGIVLSLINIFVPQLDSILSKFAFLLIVLCMISAVLGAIVGYIVKIKK